MIKTAQVTNGWRSSVHIVVGIFHARLSKTLEHAKAVKQLHQEVSADDHGRKRRPSIIDHRLCVHQHSCLLLLSNPS